MGNDLLRNLPRSSVRGEIRAFVVAHAAMLGVDVLEVGSRIHSPNAWWCSNRDLAVNGAAWLGIDLQAGAGVDRVENIEVLPDEWSGHFSGILCSEVMEHVQRPHKALTELLRVLKPGGYLLVTTLTAFPLHNYPGDYRRWTESGLAFDLQEAGFEVVKTARAGSVMFRLNDHGEQGITMRDSPIHVFAVARKPRC